MQENKDGEVTCREGDREGWIERGSKGGVKERGREGGEVGDTERSGEDGGTEKTIAAAVLLFARSTVPEFHMQSELTNTIIPLASGELTCCHPDWDAGSKL